MPSLTRGQRRLLQYATRDSDTSHLKRKCAEEVAPVLRQRKQKRRCSSASTTETAETSKSSLPLCSEVLKFVQQHCPQAPRKLSQSQLRLVDSLSNPGNESTGKEVNDAFSVKRMEVTERVNGFDVVAFAALQRRALLPLETSHGASLLVLVEDDADAKALADHVSDRYNIKHTLVMDGSRFPTYPTLPDDAETDTVLMGHTVLVIGSLQSFLAVDARSAVWKFIGAYVVLLKSSSGTTAASKRMTEEARQELLLKLCRQRWRCVGHVHLAAVMAPSRQALFAPLADALTTSMPATGVEKNTITAGSSGISKNQETVVTAVRRPVTAHYAVVEGSHRFQTLYALLMSLRAEEGVVVHFATKEACQFMYDAIYALGELPSSLLLLTDYEGASSYASVQDNDADRQRVCTQFDKVVVEASQQNSSGEKRKDRVVLFSAFGLVPQRGTIFVQYDIMVDIVNFAQFVSDVLTPAAYNEVAMDPSIRRRSRTPPPLGDRKESRSGAASKAGAPPPAKTMYQHILVLLRRNELQGALRHLQGPAKRLQITFEQMPQLPSATRFLLSVQKMRSLHKKQFAVQNAAYAAYRATMLLYSLIGPAAVYNERRVDLAKVAEEFGYAEIPLLDLRTRDTAFRPKEDIFRAAREQALLERRQMRAYVREHIIGVAPEAHVADDEAEE
ncbi:hypothetical protein DQ04_04071060 [Trypanosoma grayi]|uniref:hypothetical protein n=1 Tax=Trypanosoma grayi TaxID=71804 RepID=UPI0004F3F1E6|nr:hypothetical protein DQ04_04071060 [Trypanosoma grayi]KEG10186.1 hypothetical protein DQ04_04071060 [Trypanosoma grayi]